MPVYPLAMLHQTQFTWFSVDKNHLHCISFLELTNLKNNSKTVKGRNCSEGWTGETVSHIFHPYEVLTIFFPDRSPPPLLGIRINFQKWNIFLSAQKQSMQFLFQLVCNLYVSKLQIPHMTGVGQIDLEIKKNIHISWLSKDLPSWVNVQSLALKRTFWERRVQSWLI